MRKSPIHDSIGQKTMRYNRNNRRRGRDSNSRKSFPFSGLANRRTRPLCDLSMLYLAGGFTTGALRFFVNNRRSKDIENIQHLRKKVNTFSSMRFAMPTGSLISWRLICFPRQTSPSTALVQPFLCAFWLSGVVSPQPFCVYWEPMASLLDKVHALLLWLCVPGRQ